MDLLLFAAFIALQAVILFSSVACYAKSYRVAYYAALYWPVITFASVAAGLGVSEGLGEGEGWLGAAAIQFLLSLTYNLHISFSEQEES